MHLSKSNLFRKNIDLKLLILRNQKTNNSINFKVSPHSFFNEEDSEYLNKKIQVELHKINKYQNFGLKVNRRIGKGPMNLFKTHKLIRKQLPKETFIENSSISNE